MNKNRENPEKDIKHYVIYRSPEPDGKFVEIGVSKTSEYVNEKLTDYTRYYYYR